MNCNTTHYRANSSSVPGDPTIQFYTGKLRFTLAEDTRLSDTKRWVVVRPPGSDGCGLLLAKAVGEAQGSRVGDQTGGRVAFFLHTDHFDRDYQHLLANGITIVRQPVTEGWGTVAVFEDLYGNRWDLIGPAGAAAGEASWQEKGSGNNSLSNESQCI